MSVNNNKYIFISGLHRSGTTLLHDIIAQSEKVAAFTNTGVPMNEGQFLQSVFPRVQGGPGKFGFYKSSHLTEESSEFLDDSNRLKLINEWHNHWRSKNGYFLEKSPPNILKTRFLQEIFPNSYFITIVRHPIAVSYATKKWSKSSLNNLFEHWLKVHDIYSSERQHLVNEISLKYEDLIDPNNKEVFSNIENFLDLSIDLNGFKMSNANLKYFQKWKKGSLLLNKKRLVKKFEEKFNSYGYSLLNY